MGGTLNDPKYQALVARRSLARETLRQESQARVATLGAQRALVATQASMQSMMATIEFCNSVMSLMDGLSAAIRESEGLRRYMDLLHAVDVHRRSLQASLYVRPFLHRDAQGLVVVDLETGQLTTFVFGVVDHYMLRELGVDLPHAAEAPGGGRLVTKAISLDPARYESYEISPFMFPHPSLLAFDVQALIRAPAIQEYDIFKAVEKGDLASVRALVAAGVDVNVFDLHGQSPLCWGAVMGRPEIVRLLLASGADLGRIHAKFPFEMIVKDANYLKSLCKDDDCRSRFDETLTVLRNAKRKQP